MQKHHISKSDWEMIKDRVEVKEKNDITFYLRKDLNIDPDFFLPYLADDKPPMINQNRARCVQEVESPWGNLYTKRYHYHRTYRKKHRWFLGYQWQRAHGPTYFARTLYAFDKGHHLAEPLLAARRKSKGMRQESLVVMKKVPGTDLEKIFSFQDFSYQEKLSLLGQSFRAVQDMHKDGICFGDTKIRHHLYEEDKNRIYFVDYDKIRINTSNPLRQADDYRRILKNSNKLFKPEPEQNLFKNVWDTFTSNVKLPYWRELLLRIQFL